MDFCGVISQIIEYLCKILGELDVGMSRDRPLNEAAQCMETITKIPPLCLYLLVKVCWKHPTLTRVDLGCYLWTIAHVDQPERGMLSS